MQPISPASFVEPHGADGGSAHAQGPSSVDACGIQDSRSERGADIELGAQPVKDTKDQTCKRICMFMFKGGVYKTSTSIHAAAALAGVSFN